MTCQRNWLYLESIFSAPDIQRQLPAEAKMFLTVDKSWKEVMRKVHRLPNALRDATQPGVCYIHVTKVDADHCHTYISYFGFQVCSHSKTQQNQTFKCLSDINLVFKSSFSAIE